MSNSQQQFMAMIHADFNRINLQLSYIDMCGGDKIAGILLSQIVYWHLPNRDTGNSKLRVKQDGHYWIVKGREEWYAETRITPKEYDRAVKILKLKQLVITDKFLYWDRKKGNKAPAPTIHLRLNWEVFAQQYSDVVAQTLQNDDELYFEGENEQENAEIPRGSKFLPKGEKRISPTGNNEFPQKGRTLDLSETTLTDKVQQQQQEVGGEAAAKFLGFENAIATKIDNKAQQGIALEIAKKHKHNDASIISMLGECIIVTKDDTWKMGELLTAILQQKDSSRSPTWIAKRFTKIWDERDNPNREQPQKQNRKPQQQPQRTKTGKPVMPVVSRY